MLKIENFVKSMDEGGESELFYRVKVSLDQGTGNILIVNSGHVINVSKNQIGTYYC